MRCLHDRIHGVITMILLSCRMASPSKYYRMLGMGQDEGKMAEHATCCPSVLVAVLCEIVKSIVVANIFCTKLSGILCMLAYAVHRCRFLGLGLLGASSFNNCAL